MRIALLADAQNRHTFRWSTWLASQGMEVHLLSDRPPRAGFDYQSINLYKPEWTFWRNLYAFKVHGGPMANSRFKYLAWRDTIRQIKPDILHAHQAQSYGPTLAHFLDLPRVLTPWGPDVEAIAGDDPQVSQLVLQALRSADVITTNGPGLEDHWSRLAAVPKDRFDLWSWGIDVTRFAPNRAGEDDALARRFPALADHQIILSPRLPTPYYNIALIVSSWNELLEGRAYLRGSARLVVLRCGVSDEVWAPTASAIAASPWRETIIVVDSYLSEQEMAAMYRRSTACVMLPRTDLLSMSLLESLSCGCIPIVENLPVHAAALGPIGATGSGKPQAIILAELTTGTLSGAMAEALGLKDETRFEIARSNRAAIMRDHDWGLCAPRLLRCYERVLQR